MDSESGYIDKASECRISPEIGMGRRSRSRHRSESALCMRGSVFQLVGMASRTCVPLQAMYRYLAAELAELLAARI